MKLIINIIFAFIGFLAIILEFFVPSAGVIGIIGFGLVTTGIVLTYINFGLTAGTVFLVSSVIVGPIIFIIYFRIFPKSAIGKKLILGKKEDSCIKGAETDLLHCEGRAVTSLHPVGEALFNNKKYNVTTEGEFIEKNTAIRVIRKDGNRLVVSQRE